MSLGPFRVGDSPSNAITIEVIDDADSDLSDYTTGDAVMYDADDTAVATLAPVAIAVDGSLTFPFPANPFATPGVYSLAPTIHAGSKLLQLAAIEFVVEPQRSDGWLTLASARRQLGGDYPDDDLVAYTLLECAKLSIGVYAPTLGFAADGVTPAVALDNYYAGIPILGYAADGTTPVRPPVNYVHGQLMQARNILNSVKTDPASASAGDMFIIRPYPLDNFIKQVVRPKQGPLAVVG